MNAAARLAVPSDRAALERLQHAAYARNQAIIGSVPVPLAWDYGEILATCETWVIDGADGAIAAALILRTRPDDLYIENISVDPGLQRSGHGSRLLALALERAREQGRTTLRLLTNALLADNIAWYGRHGFRVERIEELAGRRLTHMVKTADEP